MDPYTEAGMVFTVIMTIIIGGFIVTFPVLRRLGAVMEESIRERRAARLDQGQVGLIEAQMNDMKASIDRMEGHLHLLGERQDFVENLLTHREPDRLPERKSWDV